MIRVERTERDVPAGEVEALLDALDSRLGTWLGCDVEAEGLYQRESMGCVDPAVGFFLDGNLLTVRSFSPVGHALLEKIRPLAVFEPAPGGLVIRFAETKSVPHPVIGVLRAFLGQFACGYRELALFGAFSFDYYRLADGADLPADGKRRMVLYFPERVLVAESLRTKWVEFRFPDLTPVPDRAPVALEQLKLQSISDDLLPGGHARQVRLGRERLLSGEVFSLVLSQTFRRRVTVKPSAAFSQLRRLNPYPAMFFANLSCGEILFGASPDVQVRVRGELVESAPVCGTVRRGADPVDDADQCLVLLNSTKEEASLAACADSDRNDKAKVCEPGSLELVSSRRVHFFSTIIHTIDHTRGRRRSDVDVFDVLLAHSAPATVTGIPKPAAILAIETIESTWRGWYAGAVVRLATDGSMDAFTVLRAARVVGDIAEVRTGGNLLVDSDPESEEEETQLKAQTLIRVLCGESPRQKPPAEPFTRRFEAALWDAGDPMGALLIECLASVSCEVLPDKPDSVAILGDGRIEDVNQWLKNDVRPLIAIGAGGLSLLKAAGGQLTTLAEPRFARRVQGQAQEGGFANGLGTVEVGLYTTIGIKSDAMPATWRPAIVSLEGWVLAAWALDRPQVAILCRPDSVQSSKHGAGRKLLRAALEWVSDWKAEGKRLSKTNI